MSWDPFEEMRRLEQRINRIFREFWEGTSGRLALPAEKPEELRLAPYKARVPSVDVLESNAELKLIAELPGVEKKDLKLSVSEREVEISAETKQEEIEEREGYLRRERAYTKFYRRMPLPVAVDPEKTQANFKRGLLEVILPKQKVTKKKDVSVE
ncbi:MAG: Hsp20/alpha crystallin family protein [Candidatus Hodarchaeota archaeon]